MIKANFVIVSLFSINALAASIEGTWALDSLHCKSGATIQPAIVQLFKSTEMTFTAETLSQTMTFMPTCKVASVGTYKLEGSILEIGHMKASKSQTCPAGFNVADKKPSKAQVSFQQNGMALTVDGTGVCPVGDPMLLIMKKKVRSLF
jgi:hypothetical protein